mgnify:CR=1 FL=1
MRREALWEAAASNYVHAALEIAEWDFALGVVLLPEIEQCNRPSRPCRSLHELRHYLFGIARLGWDSCLPRDADQPAPAFEENDIWARVDAELLKHGHTFELMQWLPKVSLPPEDEAFARA